MQSHSNTKQQPDGPASRGNAVTPSPQSFPGRCRHQRRWLRRLLAAGVLVTMIVACHVPLLRIVAGVLVVDDPLVPAEAVVVVGRSGLYRAVPIDELVGLYRKGLARQIVLIEDRSSRIVEAGIVPTLETVLRRELAARGIPEKVLTALPGDYHAGWNSARRLSDWLQEHPTGQVTVLCDEFDSRRSAYVVRSVLRTTDAARVRWRALPDQRFQTTNWWRTRQGMTELFGAYVSLLHTYLMGEPGKMEERWNPDQFERKLRELAVP